MSYNSLLYYKIIVRGKSTNVKGNKLALSWAKLDISVLSRVKNYLSLWTKVSILFVQKLYMQPNGQLDGWLDGYVIIMPLFGPYLNNWSWDELSWSAGARCGNNMLKFSCGMETVLKKLFLSLNVMKICPA